MDTRAPASNVRADVETLRRAVLETRPIFGDIMRKHGDKILFEYTKDFMAVNASAILDARKPELIQTTASLLKERLGEKVAAAVEKQLTSLPLVSTTDHHTVVQHPFFLNANIISGIPYFEHANESVRFLIVFSFSSISMNNPSGYPRGLLFHAEAGGKGKSLRHPIFPDTLKMATVYNTRAFVMEDLARSAALLQKYRNDGRIEAAVAERMSALLLEDFAEPDILASTDFSHQITKINYRLWPRFFHEKNASDHAAARVPHIIYLEIETLVTELLLRYHIPRRESLIYQLFFRAEYRELAVRMADGLPGSFSLKEQWGSYFFWAVDDKNRRVQLFLEGDKLCTVRHEVICAFDPESIANALKERRIFPNMFLCYLLVSLYYGMKCLGGFSQVHDLTMAKNAWKEFLEAIGTHVEANALDSVQTKELGGDGLVLAYGRSGLGPLVPLTGLDMLDTNMRTRFTDYVELSKKFTLSEIMNPMLPEIYKVVSPLHERVAHLSAVTQQDILNETNVEKKLQKELSLLGH